MIRHQADHIVHRHLRDTLEYSYNKGPCILFYRPARGFSGFMKGRKGDGVRPEPAPWRFCADASVVLGLREFSLPLLITSRASAGFVGADRQSSAIMAVTVEAKRHRRHQPPHFLQDQDDEKC